MFVPLLPSSAHQRECREDDKGLCGSATIPPSVLGWASPAASSSHACLSTWGLDSFKGPRWCWQEPVLFTVFPRNWETEWGPRESVAEVKGPPPINSTTQIPPMAEWQGLRDGLSEPRACQLGSLGVSRAAMG